MSFRQRKFNYKVSISGEGITDISSVTIYQIDIPTYTKQVTKYRNSQQGTVIVPQREDPPEFTFMADLDIPNAGDSVTFSEGGASQIMSTLYSLLDSEYDTIDINIQMLERVNDDEVVTWSIVAEDCHIVSLAADTLQSMDDAEVVRATITVQPTRIKNLKVG